MASFDSPTWLSGGKLSGIALVTMVERERVLEALSGCPGLALGKLEAVPKGRHPICLDFFHVEDGQVQIGPRNQNEWWRTAADASGQVLGGLMAAWGAGASALAGTFTGAALGLAGGPLGILRGSALGFARGARSGASRGYSFGRQGSDELRPRAEAFSQTLTHSLGDYREVMLGVPGVTCGGAGPFMFVLEMLSDGAVAVAADRAFGFGFNKRPARFACTDDAWHVQTLAGEPLIAANEIARRRPERSRRALPLALRWLSQPLLGSVGRGRLALSVLERDYGERPKLAPVGAIGEFSSGLTTRVIGGAYRAPAKGAAHPWGSVAYAGAQARISLPRPFVPVELRG